MVFKAMLYDSTLSPPTIINTSMSVIVIERVAKSILFTLWTRVGQRASEVTWNH